MAIARVLITFALLGLLTLSILVIQNVSQAAWHVDQQYQGSFLHAPGCFPQRDQSQVDNTLPPCQNVTFTVTAKPQYVTVDHHKYQDYPRTHRQLTLRDASGRLQTVGDIYEDMWNSIAVGGWVSAVVWRGQIQRVSANGYNNTILHDGAWRVAESRIWPWLVVALVCTATLSLLWKPDQSRTDAVLF